MNNQSVNRKVTSHPLIAYIESDSPAFIIIEIAIISTSRVILIAVDAQLQMAELTENFTEFTSWINAVLQSHIII